MSAFQELIFIRILEFSLYFCFLLINKLLCSYLPLSPFSLFFFFESCDNNQSLDYGKSFFFLPPPFVWQTTIRILAVDVRAKNFHNTDFFFSCFCDGPIMSNRCQKIGVTDFVFEIKRVENYPNFDKSALVTPHGLSYC